MKRTREIEFREGEFIVKTLSGEELQQAYRLRHRVFAESLGWVSQSDDRREVDLYDLWGTMIGLVRDDGTLAGVARLLPSSGPFMLEQDLASLLPPGYQVRKAPDTAEITRLAIDPDIRDQGRSGKILRVLLKGVYQWAIENEIRFYYLEVEERFLRVLRACGFPCEPLGPAVSLPPAYARSVAALYDMVQFDQLNSRCRPHFREWMSVIQTLAGDVESGRDALSMFRSDEATVGL
ncbi:MAG: GNAT family N-acetyltransferase [Nitrospira sp.]